MRCWRASWENRLNGDSRGLDFPRALDSLLPLWAGVFQIAFVWCGFSGVNIGFRIQHLSPVHHDSQIWCPSRRPCKSVIWRNSFPLWALWLQRQRSRCRRPHLAAIADFAPGRVFGSPRWSRRLLSEHLRYSFKWKHSIPLNRPRKARHPCWPAFPTSQIQSSPY